MTFTEVEGFEQFTLRSVGIDIGSSTAHLVLSRITLRRQGAALSSNFRVTERQVVYESPIALTPYLTSTLIDTEQIRELVGRAYGEAGVTPEDIDTGAVVITGEALKKENAEPIARLFAQESGKFICASAGPHHEALLAAHGCGAVALSQANGSTVLNIDIGGGTTKLSLIRQGTVVSTAAISVGARLVAFSPAGDITRLEEPGRLLLAHLGHSAAVGQPFPDEPREALAGLMAEALLEALWGGPLSPLVRSLLVTEPLPGYRGPEEVDQVVFSGGVSEYIYHRETAAYGDLGPLLARRVRDRLADAFPPEAVREAVAGIRATVIGAGSYTMQASGSTSHLSGAPALPAYGLKVARPMIGPEEPVAESLALALAKFDLPAFGPGVAFALSLPGPFNYPALRRVAEGIATTVAGSGETEAPVFIVTDRDIAKSLGGILQEEFLPHRAIVVVDGIDVGDLDYLDLGRPMGISEVVPVTVKSLVFPGRTLPS